MYKRLSHSSSSSDLTTSNLDSDSDSGGLLGGLKPFGGLLGGGDDDSSSSTTTTTTTSSSSGGVTGSGFGLPEVIGIVTLGLVILYFAGLFTITPLLISTLTGGDGGGLLGSGKLTYMSFKISILCIKANSPFEAETEIAWVCIGTM